MKKANKIVLSIMLLAIFAVTLFGISACNKTGNDTAKEYTIVSSDDAYELVINSSWTCQLRKKGQTNAVASGDMLVRIENSAIVITLNDVYATASTVGDTINITYSNEALNIGELSFSAKAAKLYKAIDAEGIVLKVSSGGGGTPMGGFSMATSLFFWNSGKMDISIIKVQSTVSFTYTENDGLQFGTTATGKFSATVNADGDYVVHYSDLTAALPFGLSNSGDVVVPKADLDAAILGK